MTDIALIVQNGDLFADIAVAKGDLVAEDGMDTAIVLSLFSDARAADDDVLPNPGGDRRGWWGDAYAEVPGDVWGSKLWLLGRSVTSADVVARCEQYASEALAWMTEDGVAASVTCTASLNPPQGWPAYVANPIGWIWLGVVVQRPDGSNRKFDYVWNYAS